MMSNDIKISYKQDLAFMVAHLVALPRYLRLNSLQGGRDISLRHSRFHVSHCQFQQVSAENVHQISQVLRIYCRQVDQYRSSE